MKQYISQREFRKILICLFDKINSSKEEYDFLYGIANGGLNISFPISNFFNIYHKTFYISFYDGDKKLDIPKIPLFQIESLKCYRGEFKKKFLWVDDIVDNGSTLKWFIENTGLQKGKDFDVAVLHWCQECSPNLEPEFYVNKKQKEDWIVYPWEV